jgi:zinc D-Ala-D-Ala carboxypeptidase
MVVDMNWDLYKNFGKSEFDCKHTGKNEMRPEFMQVLQEIRITYNKPMVISSGYRDKSHPIEAKKSTTGSHALGCAADISIEGVNAMQLINIAYNMGIRRIGVNQKGGGRFIHLDIADKLHGFPQSIWSY